MTPAQKRMPSASKRADADWRKYPTGEMSKTVHIHEQPNEDEDDGAPCFHVQLNIESDGHDFAFRAELRSALLYGSKLEKEARGYAFATENHARDAAQDQADRWRRQLT